MRGKYGGWAKKRELGGVGNGGMGAVGAGAATTGSKNPLGMLIKTPSSVAGEKVGD